MKVILNKNKLKFKKKGIYNIVQKKLLTSNFKLKNSTIRINLTIQKVYIC